jgi:hypothetical protein
VVDADDGRIVVFVRAGLTQEDTARCIRWAESVIEQSK